MLGYDKSRDKWFLQSYNGRVISQSMFIFILLQKFKRKIIINMKIIQFWLQKLLQKSNKKMFILPCISRHLFFLSTILFLACVICHSLAFSKWRYLSEFGKEILKNKNYLYWYFWDWKVIYYFNVHKSKHKWNNVQLWWLGSLERVVFLIQ